MPPSKRRRLLRAHGLRETATGRLRPVRPRIRIAPYSPEERERFKHWWNDQVSPRPFLKPAMVQIGPALQAKIQKVFDVAIEEAVQGVAVAGRTGEGIVLRINDGDRVLKSQGGEQVQIHPPIVTGDEP